MSQDRDRELGMFREITRRDFLNGVAIGAGAVAAAESLLPGVAWATEDIAPQEKSGYYPPALTGLRGSHSGSFEDAHKLRDGNFWKSAGKPADTGQSYDLIIVGGGISGLSAAYFWREQKSDARILILDNHDDFGGHAKRNEFRPGGRLLLGNGGTQSIAGPDLYSAESKNLFRQLGIEPRKFDTFYDQTFFASRGITSGVFFDKETFGRDLLVPGVGKPSWPEFAARTPLSETAHKDLARLYTEKVDYLPAKNAAEKKNYLARTSYKDFLLNDAKVHSEVVRYFQSSTYGLYGVGIDAVPAGDLAGLRFHPGFQGMNLSGPLGPGIGLEVTRQDDEPYIYHFPDGNASIARLLVRALIPGSASGHSMEDIVLAKMDYSKLDSPDSAVRIRLNSTAVSARNSGDSSADGVQVIYVRRGSAFRARRCVHSRLLEHGHSLSLSG